MLSLFQLKEWAADPWSAFYPPYNPTMVWSVKNRHIMWVTWTRWGGINSIAER